MTDVPISRVLVANRGEIALRVVRTLRDLGVASVLPYTPEDLMGPAAELADEAYALGEEGSYNDAQAILSLAHSQQVDAIHPGYGFLSEDADFAQAVIDDGIVWIGPSPSAMRALGDKMSARATAQAAGVEPVPGGSQPVTQARTVLDFASRHGYPVALKRTDGGGGRGITVLWDAEQVRSTPAFDSARAGGATLVLERFVTAARHVETQCVRDRHGAFAVVSTRDCTLQRRNQKLLEEAPAPFLPPGVHDQLVERSRRLLEAVDYVGVATCEFLLTPEGDLWFLEVNPRLQVEHCVSEEVTGTDLVETQLRVAAGGRLGEVPTPRGHSIEMRITCEDPAKGMLPTTGTITRLRWPAGPGVRIESGTMEGDVVTAQFDPMLAKIVVTGATREQALARCRRALAETVVEGLSVCIPLHSHVLSRPELTQADPKGRLAVTTRWIEDDVLPRLQAGSHEQVSVPGLGAVPVPSHSQDVDQRRTRSTYVIELNGRRLQLTLPDGILGGPGARHNIGARPHRAPQPLRARQSRGPRNQAGSVDPADGTIAAPMQAIVTRICTTEGRKVHEGDLLVVLESMKMENYVHAPMDGTVTEVPVSAGQTVSAGEVLVTLAPTAEQGQRED